MQRWVSSRLHRLEAHLDVCPPQQGVGNGSKPQSLSVVGMSHVVQHHLSGHTVDSEAQSQPASDDQREDTNPDRDLHSHQQMGYSHALPCGHVAKTTCPMNVGPHSINKSGLVGCLTMYKQPPAQHAGCHTCCHSPHVMVKHCSEQAVLIMQSFNNKLLSCIMCSCREDAGHEDTLEGSSTKEKVQRTEGM